VPEKVVVHCGVADLGGLVDVGAGDCFERCEIGAGLCQRDVLDGGGHIVFAVAIVFAAGFLALFTAGFLALFTAGFIFFCRLRHDHIT
jgi:hypothetical protein